MYYAERRSDRITIHEASGAPWFEVFINNSISGYSLSGDILSISYSSGNTSVEVYNVRQRNRVR